MTRNDQNLIAVHDALFAMGTKRAFIQSESGMWHRYCNSALEPNMFAMGPANELPVSVVIIGRPKPKVKS